jgi:hypothetical protein
MRNVVSCWEDYAQWTLKRKGETRPWKTAVFTTGYTCSLSLWKRWSHMAWHETSSTGDFVLEGGSGMTAGFPHLLLCCVMADASLLTCIWFMKYSKPSFYSVAHKSAEAPRTEFIRPHSTGWKTGLWRAYEPEICRRMNAKAQTLIPQGEGFIVNIMLCTFLLPSLHVG